jgi:hypothetical protein
MVDFNNETTITKPPREVVNMIIIERWYNWQLADQDYSKDRLSKNIFDSTTSRIRLRNLFITIQAMLKRRLDTKQYDTIYNILMDLSRKVTYEELLKAYFIINDELDAMDLTRVDTKEKINRADIEEANRSMGYF